MGDARSRGLGGDGPGHPPSASRPRYTGLAVGLALAGTGFYGGMIQAGVGYLLLASLTWVARLDLVTANVLKVVIVLGYTPLSILIFASQGQIDLRYGILLGLGQSIGAWVASGMALKKGAPWIRWVLGIVVVLTAAKLLLEPWFA